MTFSANADTYVNSASSRTKYGTAKSLVINGSPVRRSYLRFAVSGISGPVKRVTLTLQSTAAVDAPVDVRRVADTTWNEKAVSWETAPAVGTLAGSLTSVPAGQTVIDVTGLVTTNATVSLALTGSAANDISFSSREVTTQAPTLTVTYAAPDTTAPATPTGLSATAGDATVALAWTANTETDLAGYRLYRRPAGGTWPTTATKELPGTATTWTDTTVTNNTSYDYRLTAIDTTGNESTPSTAVTATPNPAPGTTAPATPTGLSATAGDATVALAWTANTETDLAGYHLYRRPTGGTWPTTATKELPGTATTWTDTTVTNNTSYDYRLTAIDTTGNESTPSTAVTATPNPGPDTTAPATPTGLSATAGDATVALAWTANTETDLAGYRLYRRPTGGTWPTTATKALTGTATTWTDTTVTNNTSYDYRLTAIDTTGNESTPSTAVTATPKAAGPCDSTSTYSSSVLATSGLRAYWRLGDRSGTTACEARTAFPGTYSGGFTLAQQGAISGDANTAVALNGSTGYVRVPSSNGLNPTAAITVEGWVSPASAATSQTLVRKDQQYMLRVVNSTLMTRLWWTDGTYTEFASAAVMTSGEYQHVAMTYDGLTVRLFRNGVEVANRAVIKAIKTGTSALNLGTSGGYDFVNGRLDELAIYSSAVPSATVAQHYRAGSGSGITGPLTLDAAGGPRSVGLRWGAIGDASEYRLYRQRMDDSWPTAPNAVVTGAATYVDRSLTDEVPESYRVTAVVDGAESVPSPVATATPTSSVLLAAGDIADYSMNAERTAKLLDHLDGAVATLGDNAYEDGTASEFADYYEPTWGRHKWRTRPTVGDHEYRTPGAAPYYDYFGDAAGTRGRGYYSYDLQGWHIVVLNSNCAEVGGCGQGSPQEQWLRNDLTSSSANCTVAMWGDPLFTSGDVHSNDPTYTDFWRALYDNGAEIVLNGDDHAYERFAPQTPNGVGDTARGVRQFTVGTGGRMLYGTRTLLPNSEQRNTDTWGVLKLTLSGNSYSWRFVPVEGKTFTDTGTQSCH